MGGGGQRAHPVKRDWYWEKNDPLGIWRSMDWPSVRRGRQVYTEVFAPCHPIKGLTFNHFQAFMTKEEIKALAATYEVVDTEPDKDGNIITRKGKSTDTLPEPYPNSKAAAFANGGAEPPDLRTIVFGVEGGCDYIFSLLTGYCWSSGELMPVPPFAPKLKAGQFWNPYKKDCVIAMPPPLSDGMLEFEDGTPATISQMAKDVVTFLRWSAEPEYDDRRVTFWKAMTTMLLTTVLFSHVHNKMNCWMIYRRVNFRYWGKASW